ncbi:HD domain-containing phosphohydrolase [Sulfuricurvum sp.]|uniref:HD domain-containing phosphohydrolase n=1 Tax=Sulfuricurvum sp. TaxID=2025608 RepID=UPI0025FB44DC|nr:HD domain-containing phosphohydrolase [Sulfuricurvum sp.]
MQRIIFNKIALLIILFSIGFLFLEFEYKKSIYFQEKIDDLQLQYNDKVKTFSTGGTVDVNVIIRKMNESFDAQYSWYAAKDFKSDTFIPFKNEIKPHLAHEESFVLYRMNSISTNTIRVFAAVKDSQNRLSGYVVLKRQESDINRIYIEQYLKFFSVLIVLYIIGIFYRKHVHSIALLDQYKSVVDKTTLLSKTDTKGRITYANEAFIALSGYSLAELMGKHHNIVRHPDMPSSTFKEMWKTIQEGKIWHGKIKNRKKDGSAYIVDATIIPQKNEKNEIIEYIAIRHDITEFEELKELLEKDLQDSSQTLNEKISLLAQYERAIEQSSSYIRTDPKGVITYLNNTHEHLTGYAKDELIGSTHKRLRDAATPSSTYRELWDTIREKRIWKGIIKNRTKTGECIFLDTIIVPILDKNEEIREYMGIQYDVTELLLLQEDIVDTQREVIYKMGEIGETRSKETGNHVKRVAEYSRLLAIKAGMSEEDADLLYAASPMHDIGKVGIPNSILTKPGKLDDGEWEVMRSHCDIGFNILKKSERPILKAAAIISYEHHEKWDGSGYPRRLKEKEINVFGRITAIADVFDALGTKRVYKEAWELDTVLEYFQNESGKHFDPELTKLFLENISEFLLIRDKFKD